MMTLKMTQEKQQKIEDKVVELLRKSFIMDEIEESRQLPAWSIICFILNKYIQETKGDIVIPMRLGYILGPWFKWLPDEVDVEIQEVLNIDN